MKILLRVLLVGFFSCSIGSLQAQQTDNHEEFNKLVSRLEGTYQIQMINNRLQPALPISVYQEIEKQRLRDKDVVYKYNESIRIIIFSKKKIGVSNYVFLQKIVYINE